MDFEVCKQNFLNCDLILTVFFKMKKKKWRDRNALIASDQIKLRVEFVNIDRLEIDNRNGRKNTEIEQLFKSLLNQSGRERE